MTESSHSSFEKKLLQYPELNLKQMLHRVCELETRLQEIHLQTRVLLEIAKALNASLDIKVIADNIISAIVSLIPIDKASVCLYDEEDQVLKVVGLFDSATVNPKVPAELDLTFATQILRNGKTYCSSSTEPWGWACCIPMCSTQYAIGTINIHSLRHSEITPEQLEFLETVAGHATSALQNALLFKIVERESITDGLTGAYNLRYFKKRMREYISLCQRRNGSSRLGLLMFDVDHFKLFNDRYGHPFGDLVLKTVVKALTHHLREEDIFARYGGEEFILLIPDASEHIICLLSEKVRKIVEQTQIVYPPTKESVSITVSVGSTLWLKEDTISSIIERADQALYQAKQMGRNQSVYLSACS